MDLDRTRVQSGMGPPAPISELSIKAWLWIHGIEDVNVRIWFYELIKALDNERIEQAGWYKSEEEKDKSSGSSTDKSDKDAHDARSRKH